MSKETPHPACHPIRIDLTVTPLFGAVRGRSEEEELAAQVALDVSMIGDLADDQELCVLADFDSGAIRLWQVTEAFNREDDLIFFLTLILSYDIWDKQAVLRCVGLLCDSGCMPGRDDGNRRVAACSLKWIPFLWLSVSRSR